MLQDQIEVLDNVSNALYKNDNQIIVKYAMLRQVYDVLKELIHTNSVLNYEIQKLNDKMEALQFEIDHIT